MSPYAEEVAKPQRLQSPAPLHPRHQTCQRPHCNPGPEDVALQVWDCGNGRGISLGLLLAGGGCWQGVSVPKWRGLQRRATACVVLGWQGGDGPLSDVHLLLAIQVEQEPQALDVPRGGTAVCADAVRKWGPPGS